MRSESLISVLFAAGALAGPLAKRAVVTETDVLCVTATVVEGSQPTPAPNNYQAPDNSTPAPAPEHHGRKKHPQQQEQSPQPAPAPAPAPTDEYPAQQQDQSPAPGPAQASAPAPSGDIKADNSYSGQILYYHNTIRKNHQAGTLVWDDDLANKARAHDCSMNHDVDKQGGGFGQNLAAQGPQKDVIGGIVDGWYNGEVNNYTPYYGNGFPSGDAFEKTGHFTQMVWKATQKVGCYTQNCPNMGMWLTTCNYLPAGNVQNAGSYQSNVLKPVGPATCNKNSMPGQTQL